MRDNKYRNEEFVKSMAKETLQIKGHTVYMIDMEIYGGLCALAFLNNHLIYDVVKVNNTSCKTDAELRERYISIMNDVLYTDDEMAVVNSYDDFQKKCYFLVNYYANRVDRLSMCYSEITKDDYRFINGIDRDDEMDRLHRIYTITNNICFSFFKPEDKAVSDRIIDLYKTLEKANKNSESEEYMETAFYEEMNNHEYFINMQADWDVCCCFGDCEYGDSKTYVDYLTEIGKAKFIPAYKRARKRHFALAATW